MTTHKNYAYEKLCGKCLFVEKFRALHRHFGDTESCSKIMTFSYIVCVIFHQFLSNYLTFKLMKNIVKPKQ